MNAEKIATLSRLANMFLDRGNIKSYNFMKSLIYREVYCEHYKQA